MHYKPMDPVLALKAIEGFTNELEPQRLKLEAFYRNCRCPRCRGECKREAVAGHAFADPETLVPRSCLRCLNCKVLFDPHSDLILERGEPVPGIPLIKKG